jgi:hypothetical protein
MTVSLLRPDDLLSLDLEGINLQIAQGSDGPPVLLPVDRDQPAFLVSRTSPNRDGTGWSSRNGSTSRRTTRSCAARVTGESWSSQAA